MALRVRGFRGQHTHLDGSHGYICIPNCPQLAICNCQDPGECQFNLYSDSVKVEFQSPPPKQVVIKAATHRIPDPKSTATDILEKFSKL